MTSYPRFTCGTNCRKALSRQDDLHPGLPETDSNEGSSRDFFEEIKGCKTCGSELVPDGLVKRCDNNSCLDYDPQ